MTQQVQNRQSTAVQSRVSEEIIISLESLQSRCFEIQQLEPGPRKFFQTSEAMQELIAIFSHPNVMDSFMAMQGSPLGFKTDRDNQCGYNHNVVRDAVIQSFLVGIFPVNNQMNIIGGKMYIPKEGFEYLLHHAPHEEIQKLAYYRFDHMEFIKYHPEINAATIKAVLTWKMSYNDEEESFTRDVQVIFHGIQKKNNIDMAFGKAEAKMLQWLYKKLTNINIPQGDATDLEAAETIQTTGKTLEPASEKQIAKIKELLDQVHPSVKEQMTAKLDEKEWGLTVEEANTIIGPLTAKARKYAENLKIAKENNVSSTTEPGQDDLFDNAKDRPRLEKQMHKLGKDVFGDDWNVERKKLVTRINPNKNSSKDFDMSELRAIVELLADMLGKE